MAFLGNVNFVEGRTPSKTTSLLLQKCLRGDGKVIENFLKSLNIKPDAFFNDINGDWQDKHFIGQHVFKVVRAAGHEGTEHDLWTTVTGDMAPYPVRVPKAGPPKKAILVTRKASKAASAQRV